MKPANAASFTDITRAIATSTASMKQMTEAMESLTRAAMEHGDVLGWPNNGSPRSYVIQEEP